MRTAWVLLAIPLSLGLVLAVLVWPRSRPAWRAPEVVPSNLPAEAPRASVSTAPGAPGPTEAESLAAPTEQDNDSDDVLDPSDAAAVLHGRVVAERGVPPQEVNITVERTASDAGDDDGTELESKYESDGSFEIVLDPGTFRIVFRAKDWAPTALEGVTVSPGDDIRGLEVVMDPGGRISGRVVTASGDEPAASQFVTLTGRGFSLKTITDDSGDFDFQGIPSKWEGRPLELVVEAVDLSEGADRRTVRAGDDVTLKLDHRRTVRGAVVDPEGKAVANAPVFVVTPLPDLSSPDHDPFGDIPEGNIYGFGTTGCAPWPECEAKTRTDESGRFEVSVADVSGIRLAAMLGTLRAPPTQAPADAADLQLLLTERPRLRLQVLGQTPSPKELDVSCISHVEGMEFASAIAMSSPAGEVELLLWPGVPCEVVKPEGAWIVAAGNVPAGVDVTRAAPPLPSATGAVADQNAPEGE